MSLDKNNKWWAHIDWDIVEENVLEEEKKLKEKKK
jgi:hypothetical protein